MLASATSATSATTFSDFTVRQLRVARLRAAIIENEITAIAVGLNGGLVAPENAIAYLIEIGARDLLTWESSQ